MDSDEEDEGPVHPYVLQLRRENEARRQWRIQRRKYLERLMGSAEDFDWEAPAPLADYDAQLGEHAAQLRNAARYLMGKVLDDDNARAVQAAGALARLIGTNLAIAKVLKAADRANAKTVHGVPPANGHQGLKPE